jgi:uncharacterized protein YciI
MLYMIYREDVADRAALRAAARPGHLVRAPALVDAGRLLLGGPLPAIYSPEPGPAGVVGSLIVGELDSLEDAQAWIDADLYVTQRAFRRVTVRPFQRVLPQ